MSRRAIKLLLVYIGLGLLIFGLAKHLDSWPQDATSSHRQSSSALREMGMTVDKHNCYKKESSWDDLDNICQINYNCSGNQNKTWEADPDILEYSELSEKYWSVQEGGRWSPCGCVPDSLTAVVIPYRDRDVHLRVLLNNLIPFLQTQKRAFRIFVIEQAQPELFNRAALLNVGFLEASRREQFDCFIFHDVDLIPMDLCNLYVCGEKPRHLAVAINKFKYSLPYSFYCGGALAVHNSTVWKVNGFTNVMFGWGGEDDDTYARFRSNDLDLARYSKHIGKYKMIRHKRDEGNPESGRTLREVSFHWKYSSFDGLNSANYSVIAETEHHLYTHLLIRLPGPKDKGTARKYLKEKQMEYRKVFMKDTALRKKVYEVMKKFRGEMKNYNPPKGKVGSEMKKALEDLTKTREQNLE